MISYFICILVTPISAIKKYSNVKPPVSDHPTCKAKVVAYGRWSFTTCQTTGGLTVNYMKLSLNHEPVAISMYKTPISINYFIM